MITLYDLKVEIDNLFRPDENGELELKTDEEIDTLFENFNDKAEHVALFIKNLKAESDAIANEVKTLQERKRVMDNREEYLKKYLQYCLNGNKFSTSKVNVSYRKSESIEVTDDTEFCNTHAGTELVTTKTSFAPNKVAIKEAIKNGEVVEGAILLQKQNIIIK